jgi:5-methyltetrahydrofolate corrinoid/iron sulfur protein methyltransferase
VIIIGERINGMFKDVRKAIQTKDKGPIHEWVVRQQESGADYLDLNVGPSTDDKVGAMVWLVDVAQEVATIPLCLDSASLDAIEAGLARCKRPPLINSCPADPAKIDRLFPAIKATGASVIGLCMSPAGIPKNAENRVALAMELVASADAYGISIEQLFIDPLVLPVNVAQDHGPEVLETIRQVKLLSDPAPKTVVGLSNSSQKALDRPLIDRTYLAMAMAAGLDAAIANVCDEELMTTVATARIILNKDIYADSYVKVYLNRGRGR